MSFKTAITQNTNSNLNINKDYFDDRKKNINKVKDKLKVVTLNWTKRNQEKKMYKECRLRVWTKTHAKVTYTHFNLPITHTHINEFVYYYIISFLWAICLKQFKTSKDHFSKLANLIPTVFFHFLCYQWILLLGQEDQSSVEAPQPPSQ